jgi:hypothetical protein
MVSSPSGPGAAAGADVPAVDPQALARSWKAQQWLHAT